MLRGGAVGTHAMTAELAASVGPDRRAVLRLWPIVAMCSTLLVLAAQCKTLLDRAAAGEPLGGAGLGVWGAAVAFLVSVAVVVVHEVVRQSTRVLAPETRLRRALQRIRRGDLAFRVSLRRGDALRGLAAECNELLEWLNANPPAGASIGSDIVDVHGDVHVDDAEAIPS